jgi:hypothetical protein
MIGKFKNVFVKPLYALCLPPKSPILGDFEKSVARGSKSPRMGDLGGGSGRYRSFHRPTFSSIFF